MMRAMRKRTASNAFASLLVLGAPRSMVSLHGQATRLSPRVNRLAAGGGLHHVTGERPPDPNQFLTQKQHAAEVEKLIGWYEDTVSRKKQILCLTGAGVSTESGIADYRGHQGSYHRGHKPMVHDQFMRLESQRKRYWGRGMIGWKPFESAQPGPAHHAIAQLERMGKLGVSFEDQPEFYNSENDNDMLDWSFSSGQRKLALITQNVDSLHRRAGSREMIELHGRSERVKCMQCGTFRDRNDFHRELEENNEEWLRAARAATSADALRPDGDAAVQTESYDEVLVPPCANCGGFVKPDVVFFGDTVPPSRVALCRAAVDHCDGLLVVGSSLAVHSAFRHVRSACRNGTPVAILNVGETRAETEDLPVLKIEAPAGSTLAALVEHLAEAPTQTRETALNRS